MGSATKTPSFSLISARKYTSSGTCKGIPCLIYAQRLPCRTHVHITNVMNVDGNCTKSLSVWKQTFYFHIHLQDWNDLWSKWLLAHFFTKTEIIHFFSPHIHANICSLWPETQAPFPQDYGPSSSSATCVPAAQTQGLGEAAPPL